MKLVFLTGTLAGNKYEISGEVKLGRDKSNDIVLAEQSVSLIHCAIMHDRQWAIIKDLGSTNGTFVNDRRIINSELYDGDSLVIGKSRIRVEIPAVMRKSARIPRWVPSTVVKTATQKKGEAAEEEAPDVTELSGSIFGEVTYFFVRKIADGGMGAVYEAEQYGAEGFIKKVAIKTILPRYVKKEKFVSSFIGEAKIVANLVHQNIVQIHHLGRHDNGYYIAMEYIDGISLSKFLLNHLKRRRLPPVELSTFIVSRICRGLEYAHNKCDESGKPLKLVHRDVSPTNIMITHEGEVKLTDFGVAKVAQLVEQDNDDSDLVGSVEYMSPEQAACKPVDARSDLFSLGLVYYELLTGCRVFEYRGSIDKTVDAVMAASIPDPRTYNPNLTQGVLDILKKCLEKKPERRFQSAAAFGETLEREMYSKGLGPTIVSLAKYVSQQTGPEWSNRR